MVSIVPDLAGAGDRAFSSGSGPSFPGLSDVDVDSSGSKYVCSFYWKLYLRRINCGELKRESKGA